MKRKSNIKLFRLLVSASILVWVFVIIVSLLILQIRGGLASNAANDTDLKIVASGRVANIEEVGVGHSRLTLTRQGVNKYVFADSQGRFLITDAVPGVYEVMVESTGYKNYESTIEIVGGRQYNFTLHK